MGSGREEADAARIDATLISSPGVLNSNVLHAGLEMLLCSWGFVVLHHKISLRGLYGSFLHLFEHACVVEKAVCIIKSICLQDTSVLQKSNLAWIRNACGIIYSTYVPQNPFFG